MKKIKLLLTTISGVCLTTLPLVASQCQNEKQINKQPKDPKDGKSTQNPADGKDSQGSTDNKKPKNEEIPNPGLELDKKPSVKINDEFLQLNNDALVQKYIKSAPLLKEEAHEKKTAWVAEVQDLNDIELIPTETENVTVISITMPEDEERYVHLDDWLKQGKIKVDYRFKVASKADASVAKEFTTSYEIDGYISEAKAKEIFAAAMNLLDDSNFEIDKSKLLIDIDSTREDFKGTNNSYKFIYGPYYPKSVEAAISIKTAGTIAKASYEYNKLSVNPAKNELRIEPYLYLDDKSQNTLFAYRNGKQYIEGDQNTSVLFENLPSRALSAVAIATNYNLYQAFNFDKGKLEEIAGKKLNEINPSEVTVEMLNKALSVNHTEVMSKTNNPIDKFMVSSDFVSKSNLHISSVKSNENEGSIYVEFTFNTISNNDPNGTIYLGKGIEQSQDVNQFNNATFVVKKGGFKAAIAPEETAYEEKEIFTLQPGMNFENILALWNNKKDKFKSKGGAIQKYAGKKGKVFYGITSNGQGNDNKVLVIKDNSELDADSILTTNPKGNDKFLDASLDEENKQLIVKFKLSNQAGKLYKQTITLN
ncbi:hypothetical protein [Mycoplasma sp. 31_09]|uniref:hypothetical protein n=1 Tax=Mycoplasma sp. 31_09 TaxID=3401663 RepID=UPI003AB0F23A